MINGNISRTEIGLNRRSLLIWTLVLVVVILIYLGSFVFMGNLDFAELIEGFPDELITGMGMSAAMFEDVNLYHGGMVMLYGLLLASIYAMMLAGGMISRDVDLGTVEFLYTRPLSRTVIMLSKVFSFLVMIIFLWIAVYLVSTAIGIFWVAPGEYDLDAQFMVHLMGLLACLAAGGIAFAIAPLINRVQGSTSLAIGLGFFFFILNSVASMYEQLEFLRFLSIHYYADLSGAAGGEPFVAGMIVLPVIFIAGVVAGTVLLNRKEFPA